MIFSGEIVDRREGKKRCLGSGEAAESRRRHQQRAKMTGGSMHIRQRGAGSRPLVCYRGLWLADELSVGAWAALRTAWHFPPLVRPRSQSEMELRPAPPAACKLGQITAPDALPCEQDHPPWSACPEELDQRLRAPSNLELQSPKFSALAAGDDVQALAGWKIDISLVRPVVSSWQTPTTHPTAWDPHSFPGTIPGTLPPGMRCNSEPVIIPAAL